MVGGLKQEFFAIGEPYIKMAGVNNSRPIECTDLMFEMRMECKYSY